MQSSTLTIHKMMILFLLLILQEEFIPTMSMILHWKII